MSVMTEGGTREGGLLMTGRTDIFIIDTEKDLNVYKEVGILDMTDGNTDEGDTRLPEETQTGMACLIC